MRRIDFSTAVFVAADLAAGSMPCAASRSARAAGTDSEAGTVDMLHDAPDRKRDVDWYDRNGTSL
jgi:hypothetical protein